MGAPKLKPEAFQSSDENLKNKEMIKILNEKIAELVKDESKAKKAASILHMMLNNSNSKKRPK